MRIATYNVNGVYGRLAMPSRARVAFIRLTMRVRSPTRHRPGLTFYPSNINALGLVDG